MLTYRASLGLARGHFTARVGVILALGLLAGCVAAPSPQGEVQPQPGALVVVPPPPAPRFETQPPPPGESAVWDPGHWRWDGHDYAWVPGRYEARPSPQAQWRPDGWIERNGAWVWQSGHWEHS